MSGDDGAAGMASYLGRKGSQSQVRTICAMKLRAVMLNTLGLAL